MTNEVIVVFGGSVYNQEDRAPNKMSPKENTLTSHKFVKRTKKEGKIKKRKQHKLCEADRFYLHSADVVNRKITKRVISNILDLEIRPNAIGKASEKAVLPIIRFLGLI